MLDLSTIFVLFHSVFSIIGCLINIFLCYVALFKSPPIIKTYSVALINMAVTNIGASVSAFLLQQRVIPSGLKLYYISYGLCGKLGPQFCFDVFGAMLHFHTHSLWLIFLSFAYRYYVMFRKEPSRSTLQLFVLLIYIPSFIQILAMFFQPMDVGKVRRQLTSEFPQYDFTGLTVTGALDIVTFAPLYTLIHLTVVSTPLTVGIQVFRRKIIGLLVSKGVDLTTRSKNLHAQLLRTLTFQAIVPIFYLIGVAAYFTLQFGVYSHPLLEFLITTTFLFVPILTPFCSLFYVTPYRHFVLKLIGRDCSSSFSSNIISVRSHSKLHPVSIVITEVSR